MEVAHAFKSGLQTCSRDLNTAAQVGTGSDDTGDRPVSQEKGQASRGREMSQSYRIAR